MYLMLSLDFLLSGQSLQVVVLSNHRPSADHKNLIYDEVESGVWKPEDVGDKLEGVLESRREAAGSKGDD